MKTGLRSGLILLLVLSAQLFAADPPSNDAMLLTAEGTVQVSPTGQTAWSAGATNQVLHVGDRVRTAARSRATVRLSNLTILRVNELTTLQIQPPSAAGKQAGLDVKNGAAYFLSRERANETEFRTPLASGAIRGTEFNIAVADNGETKIALIDGAVALNNEHGFLDITSGDQAIVEPGKAPRKTASIEAVNSIIQWTLYYPAILDLDELSLADGEKQALDKSIDAYRSGDLLGALANYPEGRVASSDSEKIYHAAVLLSVGQVDQSESELKSIQSPLADALQKLIVTVKGGGGASVFASRPPPSLASEWLAESYSQQSEGLLDAARDAARKATEKSPKFGFAWAQLAQLEFSFGRIPQSLEALDKSLQLSPRNAEALALKGFLLASQNKISAAQKYFDDAIAADGALGNAWLGRGLTKIKQGKRDDGLKDLQTAAVLEPRRAVLRSYLAKAFSNAKNVPKAEKELELAKKFDPNDPTAWLYSALLAQQENKVNDAVTDLEKSQELNDNRRVYRSKMLLDQDRAVRSANLAGVYHDAGMFDWSVREASRAVNSDYGNYSAHMFLANSYDSLRDPKQINLRYETPWFSELLLSQLLAPVGAGNLSSYVSAQEYSKLFEQDGLGVSSQTEYLSSGDWSEKASQFGTFGNFSYSFDAEYRTENGQRKNNDLEQLTYYLKAKVQLTPKDSVLFEALLYDTEFGDVAQYYNQKSKIMGLSAPSPTFRAMEKQEPNIFLGYHHEWNPQSHTLFLFSKLTDELQYRDPNTLIPFVRYRFGTVGFVRSDAFLVQYKRQLDAFSTELQQIWEQGPNTLVAGARYQIGSTETKSQVDYPNNFPTLVSKQNIDSTLERISLYAYDQFQILDSLKLIGGVTYDRLHYPRNIDTSPLSSKEADKEQISPKAGIIWSPLPDTHLRAVYTRSLGGVFYDTSVRLEPAQVAGFNQAFRSIAPESTVGLVPGTSFETFGLGLEQSFKTRTYVNVEAELLRSDATRTIGVTTNGGFIATPDSPGATRQRLEYEEKTLQVTVNQLLGRDWSLGTRYRLSHADLNGRFTQIPAAPANAAGLNQNVDAWLHQINLFANYNLPCGFFARGEGIWTQQSNQGYTPDIPGDDFWQFNVFAGYRFYHRTAEVRVGLLNVTDQDYRLNPLNLYNELPRERTLSVSFKFYF